MRFQVEQSRYPAYNISTRIHRRTWASARKCHAAYVIPAQAGIQTEDFHINSLDSRFRRNDGILLFGESLYLRTLRRVRMVFSVSLLKTGRESAQKVFHAHCNPNQSVQAVKVTEQRLQKLGAKFKPIVVKSFESARMVG